MVPEGSPYGEGGITEGIQSRKLQDHIFTYKPKSESKLEVDGGYEVSKPSPSDVLPPERLCLLNFLAQCHPLETKCSNSWDYEGYHHSSCQI